ncbi:1,4-alpha-glucan branching enzyme [Actinokineospora alba]|uniref:1,4-alpha-glucan branching enzyme n=1 Tax=Actinokineospora alba TaxID=504798 RepID=A0A1H0HT61_9PSEU|nr:glycoside hydrolase family 57 protein [Actinokineospora alba]TDP64758.1 1,4-alpha-glucan branching enzyme [Actinokineospora alba]SDH45259.1 1,4-alpha-glucan branching enzyme [Actinokineospora alba]SDO22294.1 1,4-alpha-glucan branching enzyme [Actinokineospora alba]
MSKEPIGSFALVLHSHLPWLPHHGTWPVGEEWLYQAWAHSYLPIVDLARRFAAEGKRDMFTLGITPVLAAQLDDPYSLRGVHDWLGNWNLRAQYAGVRWQAADPLLREVAAAEFRASAAALTEFETHWSSGFSPILRTLVGSGVIELIGGPATHPFQPLLDPRLRAFALRTGLDDTEARIGHRPEGIWAPECGYAPGMETGYAAAGVRRFLVDGPALHGDTSAARTVGDSDVVCFGRDLEVTYRVWSPKASYPGDPAYRDFHTYDHPSGLKPSRVTGRNVDPEHKRPYEPALAAQAIERHVTDFVDTVVRRLTDLREQHGKPGLVVSAYDTELYGHWWHEGPVWLEKVLRALPEAGVRVTSLRGALEAGHLGGRVDLPASSWGSGKDWRVWDGEQVADLVHAGAELQRDLLDLVDRHPVDDRDPVMDQVLREALLALSSDWAFMVTKDSAADYARRRAKVHGERYAELASLVRAGARDRASQRAAELVSEDGPFAGLDARRLGTDE